MEVILHCDNIVETDIYCKDLNAHEYLSYDSAYPKYLKDHLLPNNLAKLIVVFVSNDEKVE